MPVSGEDARALAVPVAQAQTNAAASCLACQGFSTLIANLITSSSDYDVGSLGNLDKEWVEEYLDGYGQEVYLVELSKAFVGKLFCVAANICFKYVCSLYSFAARVTPFLARAVQRVPRLSVRVGNTQVVRTTATAKATWPQKAQRR